jgi:ferredoxin
VNRRLMMVKVSVDADLCQGHARCQALAPEVFDLDEWGHAVVRVDDLVDDVAELAHRAALNCPERAITVSEGP